MDFLINGEIYLKKGPELIKAAVSNGKDNEENQEFSFINFIIQQINYQTGFEIMLPEEISDDYIKSFNYILKEIESFDDSTKELMNEYFKRYISDCASFILLGGNPEELNRKSDNKAIYNYSGTADFWQFFVADSIMLMPYDANGTQFFNQRKIYKSKSDMEKDFFKLSEFFDYATFVGREFRRTEPVISSSGDTINFYMNPSDICRYIVLYATQELFLVKIISKYHNDRYGLINSLFTSDGKYDFFGKVYEEYRDTDKIYNEIIEQIGESIRKGK